MTLDASTSSHVPEVLLDKEETQLEMSIKPAPSDEATKSFRFPEFHPRAKDNGKLNEYVNLISVPVSPEQSGIGYVIERVCDKPSKHTFTFNVKDTVHSLKEQVQEQWSELINEDTDINIVFRYRGKAYSLPNHVVLGDLPRHSHDLGTIHGCSYDPDLSS